MSTTKTKTKTKSKSKSKSKQNPKAKPVTSTVGGTKPASIVITLEIFAPDHTGVRKLVASGAPRGEMPELRSVAFARRHEVLDELWGAILKRQPQVVQSAAITTAIEKEEQGSKDPEQDTSEAIAEISETSAVEAEAEDITPVESEVVSSESKAPLQQTTDQTQISETVEPVWSAWHRVPLPIIENDPTANGLFTPEQEEDAEIMFAQAQGDYDG